MLAHLLFIALFALARPRFLGGRVVLIRWLRGFVILASGLALGPVAVSISTVCWQDARLRAIAFLAIRLLMS